MALRGGDRERKDTIQDTLEVNTKRSNRNTSEIPTWRTITLGCYRSVAHLTRALTTKGIRISKGAAHALTKVSPSSIAGRDITLVNVSGHELGFERAARGRDIYSRAEEVGLSLVSSETGPQLRLAYSEQPRGECLLLGMNPVVDDDGNFSIFNLQNSRNVLWLEADRGRLDYYWSPSYRWVFGRRQVKPPY